MKARPILITSVAAVLKNIDAQHVCSGTSLAGARLLARCQGGIRCGGGVSPVRCSCVEREKARLRRGGVGGVDGAAAAAVAGALADRLVVVVKPL